MSAAPATDRIDDDTLDKHLPEYVEAEKRCGIRRSDWLPSWFVPWSPRNDNQNAEGPWSHWVALAREIIAVDEAAQVAARGEATRG